MLHTVLNDLLGIEYPVFQGGMAWIADGVLAAAVSEGGGLGIVAAGNAPADVVREQIRIAKSRTEKPFGLNIMLMSPFAADIARLAAEEKVAVVEDIKDRLNHRYPDFVILVTCVLFLVALFLFLLLFRQVLF